MTRLVVRILAGAMLIAGLAGCGVPVDDGFRSVDPDEIPPGLRSTTTTPNLVSTTTVAVPTTNPAPATTMPSEVVSLYFVLGDLISPVERRLPKGVKLENVVGILSVGPILEEDLALRSALRFATTAGVTEQEGVATVALDPTFAELSASEQRLAFAQLVYTLTSRPGIGQVAFTVDGRIVAVPRPDGSLEARPAAKEDFASLLSTPAPTTSVPRPIIIAEPGTVGTEPTTSAPIARVQANAAAGSVVTNAAGSGPNRISPTTSPAIGSLP